MSSSVPLAALYGAMGLGQALQNTQHVAWSVPRNSRPNPFYARVKTLILLLTAGLSLLAVTVVSTIASTTDVFTEVIGGGLKQLLPVLTVLVVGTGLSYLFRFAATGQHSFWRAAPGGFTLAVMWQLLQIGGAAYVDRTLVNTSSMTKTFGLVLGLIGFLWIGSVMAVLATEVNVVLARRLWPRALLTPFTDNVRLTEADKRAYVSYARMQRHKGFEKVVVRWEPGPAEKPPTRTNRPRNPPRNQPRNRPTSPTGRQRSRSPNRTAPAPARDVVRHRGACRAGRGRGPRLAVPVPRATGGRRGRRPRAGGDAAARAPGRAAPLLGLRARPPRRAAARVRRRRARRHRRCADAGGAARRGGSATWRRW